MTRRISVAGSLAVARLNNYNHQNQSLCIHLIICTIRKTPSEIRMYMIKVLLLRCRVNNKRAQFKGHTFFNVLSMKNKLLWPYQGHNILSKSFAHLNKIIEMQVAFMQKKYFRNQDTFTSNGYSNCIFTNFNLGLFSETQCFFSSSFVAFIIVRRCGHTRTNML